MHLDPPLKMLMQALRDAPTEPAPADDDYDEIRRRANATMLLVRPPLAANILVREYEVPVAGGAIRVRTYRPHELAGPLPTLFFVHGGGWFQGNLDTAEVEMGPMAEMVPCLAVSVDYRLAPEHKFPIPLDDCLAAYEWMLANAEELEVDTERIAIAGTSAGGNLAAALCLVARDRGLVMPLVQLLDVPALDMTMSSPSMNSASTEAGLTGDMVAQYAHYYLRDESDATDPYASPLHAESLAGMPPAVIIVAEHDPVRDDGERYLVRLHEDGVPAASFRVLAQFHGGWVIPFTVTSRLVPDIRQSAIRRAFDGTLVP